MEIGSMRPLRLVIVEDERPAARRLELVLREAPATEVVGVAYDGEDGLSMIRTLRPDVVLLDIRIPKISGLELAQSLADDYAPAVIFVTAFREFAVDAFELAAVDFLPKPVRPDRLAAAIERARARLDQTSAGQRELGLRTMLESARGEAPGPTHVADPGIWINEGRRRIRIAARTVEWLEAERDYVRLHAGSVSHLVRGTLQSVAERLAPANFWRVHRSAMINLDAVVAISPRAWGLSAVRLKTGAEVPVGRSYVKALRKRLGMARQSH